MTKRTKIETKNAPAPIGPYSQAIVAGGFVFCSGQIPLDPKTGELVGEGDVRAQAARVMQNITGVLEASGSSLARIVKTTIFLIDMRDFAAVNEVYGEHLGPIEPPARSTIAVAGLPRGARVEIEVVALPNE